MLDAPNNTILCAKILSSNDMMNNINVTLASETAADQKGHHQVAFYRICKGTGSGGQVYSEGR